MITSKTSFIALIGNPISHSLSPIMQNAAFQYLGLDLIYIAIPCKDEDLELVLSSLKKLIAKV
jgi:shikimate dehydrogenase